MATAEEHLTARRRDILAAAEKVFNASGYAATTIDAVAAEAGIAKGSVYNYFRSKKELFLQVFEQVNHKNREILSWLERDDLPAREKIERLLDDWFDRHAEMRRTGRLMMEFWTTAAGEDQGELSEFFKKTYHGWHELLARVVREGIEHGEFSSDTNDDVAGSLLMAVLHGLQLHSILDVGLKLDAEFVASMKRGVLAALVKPGAATDGGV